MVLSETMGFITIFSVTIVFTAFSFAIQTGIWRILLKFITGMFWMIFGLAMFFYMGSEGFLTVLSLPFAIIGMLFWFLLIHDFLDEKRKRPFEFDS